MENTAKAVGMSLPISWKHGVEIANMIRGKTVEKAKTMLDNVIAMKLAVPFKRFNNNVGHRKGKIMSGRFPVKAATHILKVLKSAESNARDMGLIEESLYIEHICVHKAGKQMHYGRKARRLMKRTHVEIVLKENPNIKAKQMAVKKKADKKKEKIDKETKETAVKETSATATKSEVKKESADVKESVNAKEVKKEADIKVKDTDEKEKTVKEEKTTKSKPKKSPAKKKSATKTSKKVKSNSKTQNKGK